MRNCLTVRKWVLGCVLAALIAWQGGGAMAQTLRIGVQAETATIDPQFALVATSLQVARHMFDTLAHPDERQALHPGLALGWSPVSDTEWEFRLRPDVRFHDGTPFTADDVAFSITRAKDVPNSLGSFAVMTRQVTGMQVVDKLTIRFRTAQPFPLMAEHLSAVPIVSRAATEGVTTADFNSGKAAIGTGPFRFAGWTKGDAVRLTRNETYWGPKAAWASVEIRPISDDGARVAALLSGTVDVIERVPTAAVASLRARTDISLAQTVTNRVIFVGLNVDPAANPYVTDVAGAPLARNPMADPRVRRAISLALNREALTNQVMEGLAVTASQLLPDGYPGTSASLRPGTYDPVAARALLSEAGFKDGFVVTLLTQRYSNTNDVKLSEAVAQMLTRVGLRTNVEAVPFSIFQPRYRKGDFALSVRGWGTETGEGSMALRSLLASRDPARGSGTLNGGHYSNSALDALLEKALATLDPAQREPMVARATEIGIQGVGLIPLQYQVAIWGLRAGLTYKARSDNYTFAFEIRPGVP